MSPIPRRFTELTSVCLLMFVVVHCSSSPTAQHLPTHIWGAVLRGRITDSLGGPVQDISIGVAQYRTDSTGPQGIGGCRGYLYFVDSSAAISDASGVFEKSMYQVGPAAPLCLAIFTEPSRQRGLSAATVRLDSVQFEHVESTHATPKDTVSVVLRLLP